jgi:hypothetical protein
MRETEENDDKEGMKLRETKENDKDVTKRKRNRREL